MVMAKAEVPPRRRVCPGCEQKVARTRGFCTQCGVEYNFEPALKAGDVVHGKFEIRGPIAFGGLGWIYLAWDNVLSRFVVLKGLLNAKDEAAAAAAVAERQFLAAVKHPKIVGIYDFVQNGAEGYIVMEYVGGRMVESVRKALDLVDVPGPDGATVRRGVLRSALTPEEAQGDLKVVRRGVLPVEEAIAYILGILPAFAYLHANQFVYCDFKPENFMIEGDDVKLIDMGGVRRIGDPNGDIYGTRGYMAPEAGDDPVEVSDLYTVGRALAVLVMDFDFMRAYEHALPPPNEQPVLAQHDGLYRFLLRATHPDPDQRFQSADEMGDQLLGVLREIVALREGPRPVESRVFSGDNLLDAEDLEGTHKPLPRLLPALKVSSDDPAADEILRLGALEPRKRATALKQVVDRLGTKSVEARLRYAEALILSSRSEEARATLKALLAEDPFDWRIFWFSGLAYLVEGKAAQARSDFGKVYFEMPGEVAPKLALAFAAEASGNLAEAIAFYSRVAKVDPGHTSACFGWARCMGKDVDGAADALGRVPASHSLFSQSRIALAQALLRDEVPLDPKILEQASATLGALSVDGGTVHKLSAKLLEGALGLIRAGRLAESAQQRLLGHPVKVRLLRMAAEREYRDAGKFAATPEEKTALVDQANRVRPRTWI
jgi:serine/threonine-protein kinase PknG